MAAAAGDIGVDVVRGKEMNMMPTKRAKPFAKGMSKTSSQGVDMVRKD